MLPTVQVDEDRIIIILDMAVIQLQFLMNLNYCKLGIPLFVKIFLCENLYAFFEGLGLATKSC